MKNIKKEYLVLAAIIVVLSAYLVFHKEGNEQADLPVLPDISKMDVTKLVITKAGIPLVIEKKDSGWVIGEDKFPADEVQIKAMVENIKNLKLTALISESDDYARYDLDDEHKITVTASNGDKPLRTFDIGKTASSYRHTFVKLSDDKRVFHAEQNFREAFEKPENDLTNKKVLALDSASVTRVDGNVEKTAFVLEKKKEEIAKEAIKEEDSVKKADPSSKPEVADNKPQEPQTRELWADASGKEKDKAKVTELLSLFTDLSCVSYIKGSKKEDFTEPLVQITLTGSKPVSLSIFGKKEGVEGGYPAVSSESPFPFVLPDDKVDGIKAKLKEI